MTQRFIFADEICQHRALPEIWALGFRVAWDTGLGAMQLVRAPCRYDGEVGRRAYTRARDRMRDADDLRYIIMQAWQKSDPYGYYLRSPAWQEKRRAVLRRAGHRCEGCGKDRPLQVHHKTYERVGDEFLFDLQALCDPCHERVHGIEKAV